MMQETQRRPGGITALAVLNFIFAASSLMGLLVLTVIVVVFNFADVAELDEARGELDRAVGKAGLGAIVFNMGTTLVAVVLQIISAIGLLRMAPLMGRVIGNAFAIVSIIGVVGSIAMGIPFSVGSVISLIYPLLVLILLNVTFRDDFRVAAPHLPLEALAPASEFATQDLAGSAAVRRNLVARFGVRHSLRGGAAVLYLLTLLGGGLMIAAAFISPIESIVTTDNPRDAARAEKMLQSGMAIDAIGWITGADDKTCEYFVKEQPVLLSAILLLLLAFMPFFACMGGFNQTAGEIGSKGLRFLLLRTDRASLFFGRFLAALVFSTIGLVVLTAVVTLYMALKLDLYSGVDLSWWAAQGTLALWLIMLPHLAATAWLSASLDSALAAFSLSMAVVSIPIAVIKMTQWAAGKFSDADLAWLDRLQPWGWKYELLDPSLATRAVAAVMMLFFTAVFLWAGLRRFSRRDI